MLMKKKTNKPKNGSLSDLYDELCQKSKITLNEQQRDLIDYFQTLYDALETDRSFKLFSNKPLTKGLYIWGDVGRGKTFLMDIFFNQVHNTPKRRVHFHEFMKEIHASLHQLNDSR